MYPSASKEDYPAESRTTEVVESAVTGDKTMDDLVQEWNEKWTSAQENNGITVD